jgi:hypothetical protein
MNNYLLEGDAMQPDGIDLIAQLATIPAGEPVPEGWRVLTGNSYVSQIARVAMRYEIEGERKD